MAHVEAGLRSRDRAMPEEINRIVTDRVSDYLFAPSADAVANLRAEGFPRRADPPGRQRHGRHPAGEPRPGRRTAARWPSSASSPGGYGLVTLHRPANVDDPAVLGRAAAGARARSPSDCPLVCPCTPARGRPSCDDAGAPGAVIRLIPPAGYLDFIALEASARLVLTDSGGVQEETTVLGVPCLTLRDNTERPITVTEGTNQLVGRDPERIVGGPRGARPHRRPASRVARPCGTAGPASGSRRPWSRGITRRPQGRETRITSWRIE